MKYRIPLLFIFITLLFLFYPGDMYYFNLFAHNRSLFQPKTEQPLKPIAPVPVKKAPYEPALSAQGVYVVDLKSFTPILKKNERMQLFPASTTKVITALVTHDIYPNADETSITVTNLKSEGQTMGLVENERISVENILYGMLVQSGNDAAYAIAEATGFEEFVKRMNKKTQELHMTQSHFKNPAGLDAQDQYTTAYDLALAARALLHDPYLAKMVSIKEITVPDADFKRYHKLTNVNKLLGEIQGIGGLKTGYTEAAGENLVSLLKNDDHEFIIVILKSTNRFEDTRQTVNWIKENITYITP